MQMRLQCRPSSTGPAVTGGLGKRPVWCGRRENPSDPMLDAKRTHLLHDCIHCVSRCPLLVWRAGPLCWSGTAALDCNCHQSKACNWMRWTPGNREVCTSRAHVTCASAFAGCSAAPLHITERNPALEPIIPGGV